MSLLVAVAPRAWVRAPGVAWVGLCLAVALHVTDDALNDFLSVYNPTVERVRDVAPVVPLPTFTFEAWITGLAVAAFVALCLSSFVSRHARWMRLVVIVVSALMIPNALGHMLASAWMGTVVPGTYSSPILLVASVWVLSCVMRRVREVR